MQDFNLIFFDKKSNLAGWIFADYHNKFDESDKNIIIFGQKDIDGTTEVFGHQLRVVTSDSMDKCDATDVSMYDIKSIPIKSMVFVELVPEDEQEAIKQLKMAAVLQYTLPGVPYLYYGDENGMEGHIDPFCRFCFFVMICGV